jgi:hypothetical protein
VAEAGSDASVLLGDLKRALEAKRLPSKVKRVGSVAFTYANLGENQSRHSGGGFYSKPAGRWTTMKLFFGEGEQESEVYLAKVL